MAGVGFGRGSYDGPRPQDRRRRRCARKRGAVHVGAMIENACPSSCPSSKAHVVAGRVEVTGAIAPNW